MDNKIVKIGSVELTEKELQTLYINSKQYIITYHKIYELAYNIEKKRFYYRNIATAGKGKNFASRGRFYAYTQEELNWLLG